MRRSRARLARRLALIAPPGPVLDVGSGPGYLVAALERAGREAIGIERTAGPGANADPLATIEGGWAAIVFWHSLEHLPTPGRTLATAAGLLCHGGVLVVAVPNYSSWQARLFGERWLALDLPRHLVHLPAAVLLDRLRALDLTLERVSFWRGGQVVFGWLDGLVGRLPGALDLYAAIRRAPARERPLSATHRLAALLAGGLLLPAAIALAALEVAARRGGTVYVEARRA